MEILNVPKSVRSIVIVKTEPSGVVTTREIVPDRSKGRKKQSKALRPLERFARRYARARATGAESYLVLHERSNRKKKNGWARGLLRNSFRAYRRGLRKLL